MGLQTLGVKGYRSEILLVHYHPHLLIRNDIIAAILCTCNTRFGKKGQKYLLKLECTHSTVSVSLRIIMQSFLMFTYLFLLFWRTVIERERNTENNSI